MSKPSQVICAIAGLMLFAATDALAADYVREHWFDYPDPFTAPVIKPRGCAQWQDLPQSRVVASWGSNVGERM